MAHISHIAHTHTYPSLLCSTNTVLYMLWARYVWHFSWFSQLSKLKILPLAAAEQKTNRNERKIEKSKAENHIKKEKRNKETENLLGRQKNEQHTSHLCQIKSILLAKVAQNAWPEKWKRLLHFEILARGPESIFMGAHIHFIFHIYALQIGSSVASSAFFPSKLVVFPYS